MADDATLTIGIRDPRSLGIGRYVGRLAAAMQEQGESYLAADAPRRGARLHFHLGNSSRKVVWQALRTERPYVLTVHDVIPRSAALMPLYGAAVYPLCVRRAARVIVHSEVAAQLLVRAGHVDRGAVEVIAFPATSMPLDVPRATARRRLGLQPQGPPLFVLPGVVKRAKLVAPVLEAAAPLLRDGLARLLLVGPVADRRVADAARAIGASLIESPGDAEFDLAIVAADCVLNLREGSVGESNGPLLDAIGAHRAVLATDNGSIREVAGTGAAFVRAKTVAAIADGLLELLDPGTRAKLEHAAAQRAAQLTWSASAQHHTAVFASVYDAG
jgi:glycosyltransferase involved in cell wall biosynthesis